MKDRIARIKQFVKDNEVPIVLSAGVFIGGVVVATYPKVFFDLERYPFGTAYNPDQPIPGLFVDEASIKRDIASGIIAVRYLREKGLDQDFVKFAHAEVARMGISEGPGSHVDRILMLANVT